MTESSSREAVVKNLDDSLAREKALSQALHESLRRQEIAVEALTQPGELDDLPGPARSIVAVALREAANARGVRDGGRAQATPPEPLQGQQVLLPVGGVGLQQDRREEDQEDLCHTS